MCKGQGVVEVLRELGRMCAFHREQVSFAEKFL